MTAASPAGSRGDWQTPPVQEARLPRGPEMPARDFLRATMLNRALLLRDRRPLGETAAVAKSEELNEAATSLSNLR